MFCVSGKFTAYEANVACNPVTSLQSLKGDPPNTLAQNQENQTGFLSLRSQRFYLSSSLFDSQFK
jgi:hypothetical protein